MNIVSRASCIAFLAVAISSNALAGPEGYICDVTNFLHIDPQSEDGRQAGSAPATARLHKGLRALEGVFGGAWVSKCPPSIVDANVPKLWPFGGGHRTLTMHQPPGYENQC